DSWQDLQPQVHAQVGDRNPQLVEITAVAPTADTAERLAEAVGRAGGAPGPGEENKPRHQLVAGQPTEPQDPLTPTPSAIDEINAQISAGAPEASFRTDLRHLNRTLEDQQSDYATMLETTANSPVGANVSVLEHAYTTRHPIRPDTKTMVAAGAGVGLAL